MDVYVFILLPVSEKPEPTKSAFVKELPFTQLQTHDGKPFLLLFYFIYNLWHGFYLSITFSAP
jgi:hypothetical protein